MAEEAPDDMRFSDITDLLSALNPLNWFGEEEPVKTVLSGDPMLTGGRSAPSISYSPNVFDLTQNIAMSTVTPTVINGPITTWSITPSLPFRPVLSHFKRSDFRNADRHFYINRLHGDGHQFWRQ